MLECGHLQYMCTGTAISMCRPLTILTLALSPAWICICHRTDFLAIPLTLEPLHVLFDSILSPIAPNVATISAKLRAGTWTHKASCSKGSAPACDRNLICHTPQEPSKLEALGEHCEASLHSS